MEVAYDGTAAASLDRKTLLALVQASRLINDELDLDTVLYKIAQQAAVVVDAEGSSVLLLSPSRDELVFQAVVGPAGKVLKGVRIKADQGIAGQVARTGRSVRVDDVKQNANFFAGIDARTKTQTSSLLAAPMMHRDEVVGVIEVINPLNRDNFTDNDLELLKIFGNLAATAARNAQRFEQVNRDNRGLRESMPAPHIIGQSPPLRKVMDLCRRVAKSKATVLITGETGTGKELVARAIHDQSDRRDKPFIAINCAALPETLLESELFGHEKGAFTGAIDRKLGRFELADGGTLFLDELGEMNQSTQVKLLRVLQEQQFVRVGGVETTSCDVRVVAATNRNLEQEMEAGRFRADLYYRLNVFPLALPPLRERIEDLPLLVKHFVQQVVPSLGVPEPRIADAAMVSLMQYHWPGNIRELRNVVERSTLLASGEITTEVLPPEVVRGGAQARAASKGNDAQGEISSPSSNASTGSKLADHERALILAALTESGWNQSEAARQLGISRDHLRYRVKKYGFQKPGKG
ncbi:MAG: sigma 54-interacting transcriptional regulator [Phycisphaeraceae bacterium]